MWDVKKIVAVAFLSALFVILYRFISFWWKQRTETKLLKHYECEWLDDEVLRTAQSEADDCGLGEAFADYVKGICQHTGEPRIKVGHLLWIFDQLEEDRRFHPAMLIPRFEAPSQEP
jgi:hypothetical protein